ncbi:hypothetical protein VULLAG_LOCUS556 [Vulpes lagopus]
MNFEAAKEKSFHGHGALPKPKGNVIERFHEMKTLVIPHLRAGHFRACWIAKIRLKAKVHIWDFEVSTCGVRRRSIVPLADFCSVAGQLGALERAREDSKASEAMARTLIESHLTPWTPWTTWGHNHLCAGDLLLLQAHHILPKHPQG